MNDLTLFMPFKVSSAETDMYGRLRPGALLNLLIESAIRSADTLGFGYEGLQKHKLFWVLSRISLKIYRPLRWYEIGTVETWPKDLEKVLYLRDFLVKDQDQEVVCRATSGWLAIDADTKRPKKLDDIDMSLFNRMKNKHAMNALPEKLQPVGEGDTFDVQTTYFDIDLNAHVTSSRYIDWMMNTFESSFHKENYPTELSINFLRETKPGHSIRLTRQALDEQTPNEQIPNEQIPNDQAMDDQVFDFEGLNNTLGVPAFFGRVQFSS